MCTMFVVQKHENWGGRKGGFNKIKVKWSSAFFLLDFEEVLLFWVE